MQLADSYARYWSAAPAVLQATLGSREALEVHLHRREALGRLEEAWGAWEGASAPRPMTTGQ